MFAKILEVPASQASAAAPELRGQQNESHGVCPLGLYTLPLSKLGLDYTKVG